MGKKKSVEARAAKFIERVAQKLSEFRIVDLTSHLEKAVAALPQGELQSALASDLTRFASRLQERLAASGKNQGTGADTLLRVARGPVSTDEAFLKAAQAAVSAAEKCGSEHLKELAASCRRLLSSRLHSPPGLWWTYSALELLSSPEYEGKGGGEQRCLHVVSTSMELMDRIRSLTVGRCDPLTSVAALAPVVAALFQAGCLLKSASDGNSKPWRKAVKSLHKACTDVFALIALQKSERQEDPGLYTPDMKKLKDDQLDYRGLRLAVKGVTRVTGLDFPTKKGVAELFPLWLDEMVEAGDMETCARAVAGEALLLKLMVRVMEELCRRKGGSSFESPDFCEEMRFLAVHGASDFLLDLLLVSKELSAKPLLDGEEEVFLRGILYDVISMDSPWPHEKYPVFLRKLALARRAVVFYRSHGERTKALKLSSRLFLWDIPSGFSGWLQSLNVKKKPSEHILNDSRALLGWLTDTADEADIASILSSCTKAKAERRKASNQKLEFDEADDTFVVDTKGEPMALEALDKAFVDACEAMRQNQLEKETPAVPASDSDDESHHDMELGSNAATTEDVERDTNKGRSLDSAEGNNAAAETSEDEEDRTAAKEADLAASIGGDKLEDQSTIEGVMNQADLRDDDGTETLDEGGAEQDMRTSNAAADNLKDAVQAVLDEAGILDAPATAAPASATADVVDHGLPSPASGKPAEDMETTETDAKTSEKPAEDMETTEIGAKTSEKPAEDMETTETDAKTLEDEPEHTTEREAQAEAEATAAEATAAEAEATAAEAEATAAEAEATAAEAEAAAADEQLLNEAKDTAEDIILPEAAKDMETDEQPSTPALERKAETPKEDAMPVEQAVMPTLKKTGNRRSKELRTPKLSFLDAPAEAFQTPTSIRYTRSGRKYGDPEAVAMSSRKKRRATEGDTAAGAK